MLFLAVLTFYEASRLPTAYEPSLNLIFPGILSFFLPDLLFLLPVIMLMLYLLFFKYDRLLLLSEHVVHLLFYLFHLSCHFILHCDQVVHLLTFLSDHVVVLAGGARTD